MGCLLGKNGHADIHVDTGKAEIKQPFGMRLKAQEAEPKCFDLLAQPCWGYSI